MADNIVGPAVPPEIRQMADGVSMAAEALQNASLESAVGIDAITQQITEQNKIAQDAKTDRERNQLLMDLVMSTEKGDEEGAANALALRSEFNASNQRLEAAIKSGDQEVIDLERESQANILANAETEENRREANKVSVEQSKLLGKISSGIGGLVGFAKDNAIIAGGGIFAALALFAPEVMEKIINKVVDVLTAAAKIVKSLLDGDMEGAIEAFKSEWKMFTGGFILLFGGKIVKGLMAAHAIFKKLMVAVQAYKMFLATTYAGSFTAHLAEMSKNLAATVKSKAIKILSFTAKALKALVLFTWVPGMIAMLGGMLTSLGGMLVAMAPILVPILAIAAGLALLGLLLTKVRDAMGFSSVFDLVMVAAAQLKDNFAHLNNFLARIVNFIGGIIEKGGKFLGFDFELPKMEIMATDNAAKKVVELREKAKIKAAEEEEEKLKKSEITTGDELDQNSILNGMMAESASKPVAPPVVINQKQGDVVTNTSNTAVRSYRRPRSWRSDSISSSYA